jgi:hypothetical protein
MLRKLLATTSALLAAVVLIGLGQGEVGRWFRVIGGGAAVGFAIAVFAETRPDDSGDLRPISRRFGWGAVATVVVCAGIAAAVNLVLQHSEARMARKERHDAEKRANVARTDAVKRANLARAQADVSQFVTGQGFWAGQPVVLDAAVKMFGTALDRQRVRPTIMLAPQPGKPAGIHHAVAFGPGVPLTRGRLPLQKVWGIVCARYLIVQNDLTRTFSFEVYYRLVSGHGNDEAHVVAPAPTSSGALGRGSEIVVTGVLVASGPRRDNAARNTILLLSLSPAQPRLKKTRSGRKVALKLTGDDLIHTCGKNTG